MWHWRIAPVPHGDQSEHPNGSNEEPDQISIAIGKNAGNQRAYQEDADQNQLRGVAASGGHYGAPSNIAIWSLRLDQPIVNTTFCRQRALLGTVACSKAFQVRACDS